MEVREVDERERATMELYKVKQRPLHDMDIQRLDPLSLSFLPFMGEEVAAGFKLLDARPQFGLSYVQLASAGSLDPVTSLIRIIARTGLLSQGFCICGF